MKKTIYVAGPMNGLPGRNHGAFARASDTLKIVGWTVFNPSELPRNSEITKGEYMDIDLAMIRACTAIYMLDGWRNSPGALVEHAYAKYLELEIFYQGEPCKEPSLQ